MDEDARSPPEGGSQRLDKWLWYARVLKTRSLAAALVSRGRVRVNRERTQKPSHIVRPGDVVTASVGRDVRVLKVVLPGTRRGPASEAQTLYEELSPAKSVLQQEGAQPGTPESNSKVSAPGGVFETASGRPSKKERRQIIRLKGQDR